MKRALIVGLVLVAGCGPGSPQAMRDGPSRRLVFEVKGDYESVYARILGPLRAKIERPLLGYGNMWIDNDLYPGKKRATLAVWHSGMGRIYDMVIDLRQADTETTKVRICYSGLGFWPNTARQAQAWATGSR